MRRPRLPITTLMAALLITSCASFGDPLPPTVVDDTFRKITLQFRTSLGRPETVQYYLKLYEQDGKLAVCGVSVLTGRGVVDQLADLWLNEAFVYVRNRSNHIVRARFIGQVPASRISKPANCIRTETPATPALLRARVGLTGGSVHYQ